MDTVSRTIQFVKKHRELFIFASLLFLISLLSFGIGYLTAVEELKEDITIQEL